MVFVFAIVAAVCQLCDELAHYKLSTALLIRDLMSLPAGHRRLQFQRFAVSLQHWTTAWQTESAETRTTTSVITMGDILICIDDLNGARMIVFETIDLLYALQANEFILNFIGQSFGAA